MKTPPAPRHIIISHVYSRDNKGDAALTSVLVQDVRRVFPEAGLTILALQPEHCEAVFEGAPERAGFMSYVLNNNLAAWRKLARATYLLAATPLWAGWRRLSGRDFPLAAELRQTARLYAEADLVVVVGGGHIRGQKTGLAGWFNVPLLMQPLWFARLLGKPTVLYSQSVGPFLHRFEEKLVAATLPSMQLILLREDTSMALLRRLGVSANTRRAIDSGFLFDSPHQANLRARLSLPAHTLLLGVTVRSWLKGDQQVAYETAVAGALDAVTKTAPVHVVFIPQVTAAKGDDDRVTSRRVYQLMQAKHSATLVEEELTHYDVKAMYNDLDLLLGTRFHSVIFSLTAYVPVMAIEYEHKTSGIMKDLDLSEWVTKIEDVTATNLTAALQRLLTEREDYVVHLRRRLPTYQTQARQAAELLHRAYLAHTLGRNDVVEVNEGTASEGAAR